MNTTVRREDGRVWLEGVSGWSPGERESSVHAAQAAVMEAVGEDVSYEYLVGVSGLAFRMQVSKDGLCPSSPHSFCGYGCHARSSQCLPWMLLAGLFFLIFGGLNVYWQSSDAAIENRYTVFSPGSVIDTSARTSDPDVWHYNLLEYPVLHMAWRPPVIMLMWQTWITD